MKANTHPQYHTDCAVKCACGNTFVTGSTLPAITVDICSKCHPFFTGELKFVDTLGNVDKFLKRQAAAVNYTKKKNQRNAPQPEFHSLKDMLTSAKVQPK